MITIYYYYKYNYCSYGNIAVLKFIAGILQHFYIDDSHVFQLFQHIFMFKQ